MNEEENKNLIIEENISKINKLLFDLQKFRIFKKVLIKIFGVGVFIGYQQKEYEVALRFVLNHWYHKRLVTDDELTLVTDFVLCTVDDLPDTGKKNNTQVTSDFPYSTSNFSEEEMQTFVDIYVQGKNVTYDGFQKLVDRIKLR